MKSELSSERFKDFPLDDKLIQALAVQGIEFCSPVQAACIAPMLQGRDIIAEAPTGTGKTFAFMLPILEKLKDSKEGVQALVLAPTRELAQQIYEESANLADAFPALKILAIYGGAQIRGQIRSLKDKPQIIIATPGRLIDHLKSQRLSLEKLSFLVLDEADRMLDMGFVDDVRYIMDRANFQAQIGLFTATLAREVLDISWLYQNKPLEVKISSKDANKPLIKEYYLIANGSERIDAISDILSEHKLEKTLVFVNMKQSADITASKLRDEGYLAQALQGDMPQNKRNRVMQDFRENRCTILVGTDVAARGIDVDDIEIVFNYDLPQDLENYTHRIGRTGRAGKAGLAFSFVAPGEEDEFAIFCRKLRIKPEKYPWERPEKDIPQLSEAKEEEIAARIRAQSQYLKNNTKEEIYDPYQREKRRSGRFKRNTHGAGKFRGDKKHSPKARRNKRKKK